jgi:hypothetical protein
LVVQEEMNQLNSQGIFSNNPIDSNDSPPGGVLSDLNAIGSFLTSFSYRQ